MKSRGSIPREPEMTDRFDYVIVGAGSAGCVLANRLSEDGCTSICVLEAGPRDWHPYIHLPAGFIKTFHMKGINWAYQQEPGPWTGGRSIYAPRGKTLGGSSSINGHIYNRGQRQDFDTWAQLGASRARTGDRRPTSYAAHGPSGEFTGRAFSRRCRVRQSGADRAARVVPRSRTGHATRNHALHPDG